MQQKMADKLYDFKQMELDRRAQELQAAEEECRRAINTAVKDYNDALVIRRVFCLELNELNFFY